MNHKELARELIRRERARNSLHSYLLSVDLPTSPVPAMMLDEDLMGPAEFFMAKHHAAIAHTLQRTMNRPFGRCIIMAPPGSAKSLYTSVGAATWEMGRKPGSRLMLTSYGSKIAERQSRRAQQVVEQKLFRDLFPDEPRMERDAAGDWNLSNKSEMLAMGLTAGLTGNRASGAIIDDPVAGREEADSEVERQNVRDAYTDDLMTRLLPGAWVVLIMTRWHEDDLAGSILPEGWKGESGMVVCRDNLPWEVLNMPAKCEHVDDPLGRKLGEYMWKEWFPPQHWAMYENAGGPEAARAWSSLYQQRPSPQGSGRFTKEMFSQRYAPEELPPYLAFIGASDFAVTEGRNDFTEHGCAGIDPEGGIWFTDWWYKQANTAEGIDAMLNVISRRKAPMWFNEGGVIDKATRPAINKRMRERKVYVDLRSIPSMQDKVAKCSSFQARAASGQVHFPKNAPWADRVIDQLLALPAGRYDDAADVCGLIGRAVDQFPMAHVPMARERKGIKPFTMEWLEYQEESDKRVRYR